MSISAIIGKVITWFIPFRDTLWKIGKGVLAMGTFLGTFALTIWNLIDVGAAFQSMADAMNSATSLMQTLPVAPIMGMVNRLLPVNEFLVFEAILLGIMVLAIGIKIVMFIVRLVFMVIMVLAKVLIKT